MRIRTMLRLTSSALAMTTALLGWQLYTTHSLRQDLSRIQESLAAATLDANTVAPDSASPAQRPHPRASSPNSGDPFAAMLGSNSLLSGVGQMQQQIQQLMEASMFGGRGFWRDLASTTQPDIAMQEQADAYVLTIELPKDSSDVELNTTVENGTLSIEGRLTVQQADNQSGRSVTSLQTQQFNRTLRLPHDADPLGIRNKTQGNRVIVTLPKTTG